MPAPTSFSLQYSNSLHQLKIHGEVGRALVNYSSTEIARIKGLQSTEIGMVLGYADSEYVALRENVSLSEKEKTHATEDGNGGGKGHEGIEGKDVAGRDGEVGREKEKDKGRVSALMDFA